MSKAIRLNNYGDPEVMQLVDVDVASPAAGEVQIEQGAVGLNYIDVYMRTGAYPLSGFPAGIGLEGAGAVIAVGDGVSGVAVGDRVAYASHPAGAYAQIRNIAADRVVTLPDSIDDETGAAMMLQGLTAQYLLRRTYQVKPGDTILMHAAAGGVGLILCQWANHLGVTVIGTVGSEQKAELARANGCHHTINYRLENFTDKVRELTDGAGVNVVYDSIGKDTFMGSLDSLKKFGTMVTYGAASGPIPAFEPAILGKKGSLYVTRPTVFDHIAEREGLVSMAEDLIEVVSSEAVKVEINQRYPLGDAAQAHRDLEARQTTGSTVLIP